MTERRFMSRSGEIMVLSSWRSIGGEPVVFLRNEATGAPWCEPLTEHVLRAQFEEIGSMSVFDGGER